MDCYLIKQEVEQIMLESMVDTKQAEVVLDYTKTQFIIPFVFEGHYDNYHEKLLSGDWNLPDPVFRKNILEHVNNLIPGSPEHAGQGRIGREYKLKPTSRGKYELPINTNHPMHLITDESRYPFKIPDITLFLFESQVGFISFTVTHTTKDIEKIIETNYHIKHLKQYNGQLINQKEYFMAQKGLANEETRETIPKLSMADITTNLLKEIKVKSFFSSLGVSPETAIVYNTIMFDENLETTFDKDRFLESCLFKLRKSFKESYKPTVADVSFKANPHTIQLFENSVWGVSLEGLANISYLTHDSIANTFFKSNYQYSLRTSYFYLYLIALHQRYALISLNAQTQELPTSSLHDDFSPSDFEKVQKLRKRINNFILRSYFRHVSNVTHQQDLYKRIEKCLQITELKEDIRLELETLSSVAEVEQYYQLKTQEWEMKQHREQQLIQKEQEEKKRYEIDRRNQEHKERYADVFLIWSTVFVVFSAITGSWTMLADLLTKSEEPIIAYPAHIALLVLTLLLSLGGFLAYLTVKKKWKIT